MAYTIVEQPSAVAAATMATAMPTTAGLGSLVFDFEVEERTCSHRCDTVPAARSAQQLSRDKEKLIHFSTPEATYPAKLLRDVRYFMKEEHEPDAILLATKLSAVGYSVNVRTALGGGTSCFRNLRHEFLTVRFQGDQGDSERQSEFIVEPRFREHFLINHPTEEYSELLTHAPDVFVGTGARLVPIVQTLCDAMADSFERKGLPLPPWRRTAAMLSKWLPNRARDVSFSRGSAPPHRTSFDRVLVPEPVPAPPAASSSSSTTTTTTSTAAAVLQPPQPVSVAAMAAAAMAAAAASAIAPFARISDPLFVRGGGGGAAAAAASNGPDGGVVHPQLQPEEHQLRQQQQQQQQRHDHPLHLEPAPLNPDSGGARPVDEWAFTVTGFIPFGGAGGCSSDTEGPSPPAAGVAADGYRPPGTTRLRGSAAATAAAGDVTASFTRRAGATAHSSLLATHLHPPALKGSAAIGNATEGTQHHNHLNHHNHHSNRHSRNQQPLQPPPQQQQHPGVLETRPPAHWGEAPIHRVRMGFNLADPKQREAPQGLHAGLKRAEGHSFGGGQARNLSQAQARQAQRQ